MAEQITQVIPTFTTTPNRNQPATFSADTDQYHIELAPFTSAMNTFSTQANALSTEVNTKATEAEASATSASLSAAIATASANYKGDWSAGYNGGLGYSLNDSVSYTDGFNYVSKVNSNTTEPTSQTNTTEWNYIEAFDAAKYYTKTDLNNGSIDTRYYTKAEVYNKTEGDNRYKIKSHATSFVIYNDATLAKIKDATETSDTTTAVYQVGDYVYNSTSGIMYECILVNTIGILLTNATYFTAVTSNTLSYTYLNSIYTNGKGQGGYQILEDSATSGTITGASGSGVRYVAKEYNLNSFIFATERPEVVTVEPSGVQTNYKYYNGKWYGLDGNVTTNPIAWFKYPYQVANGVPQVLRDDLLPLAVSAIFEGATFTEFVELQENRKVIELGTIFSDNRYVVDNPFGNENYMDCDVKIQIFLNSKWCAVGTGSRDIANSDYGVISESMEEGIVVQTAQDYIHSDDSVMSLSTSGADDGNQASALARVIVTYQGVTK